MGTARTPTRYTSKVGRSNGCNGANGSNGASGSNGRAAKLRAQRRAAFERLMMEHLDSAYGGALRLTRSKAEAENLVRETVGRAMQGFDHFRPGANFKAWVFDIMTNLYLSEHQPRARQRAGAERARMAGTGWPDLPPDPQLKGLRRIRAADLQKALAELPSELRTVVMLADEQGFSYEEIASMMRRPIGAVRTRLHRGRRMLAHRLQGGARSRYYTS